MTELADCIVAGQSDSPTLEAEFLTDPGLQLVDAILWDVGWEAGNPQPDWLETNVSVVALLADDTHAAAVWNGGVRVLLRRNTDVETVLQAVHAANHGLIVIDPILATPLLTQIHSTDAIAAEALTPRETEVLELLTEGLTNKGIAQRLDISDHTVKFHVNAIMSKLGAQSRTEAVVQATRLGIVSL